MGNVAGARGGRGVRHDGGRLRSARPAGLGRVRTALLWLLFGASEGCVFTWGTPDPEADAPRETIDVRVDNGLDEPILVRIDARRVGEAKSLGRTVFQERRQGIEWRQVRICVHGLRTSRDLCDPGRLYVPASAREILIDVRRGRVRASVL